MIIENGKLKYIEKSDIINGTCTIPEGVTYIGDFAFAKCKKLRSIKIPDFCGCESLEQITLPENLSFIDDSAFEGCKNLKSIEIPEGVTYIGKFAFEYCNALESITIPKGMTYISRWIFADCKSLKNIIIPEGVTAIDAYAFCGCESLENIKIPESVTFIDDSAFCDCENLTQIQWGDTVYHVKCIDNSCMNILHEKKFGSYTVYKCRYFPETKKIVWAAEKDGMTAHGKTIQAAIQDVEFKLLKNRDISEHVAKIKSQGYVTPMDYRLITGACETGTNEFLKRKHLSWTDKRSIQAVIRLTEGEYGHKTFVKAMKDYGCIS